MHVGQGERPFLGSDCHSGGRRSGGLCGLGHQGRPGCWLSQPQRKTSRSLMAQSKNFSLIRRGQRSWFCLCLKTTVTIVDLASFRLEKLSLACFQFRSHFWGWLPGLLPILQGCTPPCTVAGCSAWGWSSRGSPGEGSLPMELPWEDAAIRSLPFSEKGRLQTALDVVVVVGGGSYFKLEQLRFGNQLG